MRSLGEREQVILALCIGVVWIYVTMHFVIKPLRERSQSVSDAILSQKRILRKNLLAINKAKGAEAKESYYRSAFRQAGTDEESVSKLISEIEKVATKVDLHISELKPAVMKRQGRFNAFSVNLVFEAPFDRTVEFLDAMQGKPYYFNIDELDIVKPMRVSGTDLRVNLSLSRIFVLE